MLVGGDYVERLCLDYFVLLLARGRVVLEGMLVYSLIVGTNLVYNINALLFSCPRKYFLVRQD